MRGLLVVNPRATTTSPRVTDVLVNALQSQLELTVELTRHREHGTELGRQARHDGTSVVLTLGGDGVVNEVVNGMLCDGPGPDVPILGLVPGGSANVFARSLGVPLDPVEAVGVILSHLRNGTSRSIGLGRADERWFVANAGLGLDAEIIESMERYRRTGGRASPLRYLITTIREVLQRTDRKVPALTLDGSAGHVDGVFVAFVQNTSPWTYLGAIPINACPDASFDTGLDVFAMRSLGPVATTIAAQRMLTRSSRGDAGGDLVTWHDLAAFTATARRPIAMQIDGESVPMVTQVVFAAVPDALRVLA
mgnify:CR=1 FL=1